jgi:4-hydroxy-3-methylbut-2-enyl diphosphate reductase
VVLIVGSPNSSNSNRLREVATQGGARAYMLDRAEDLQAEWVSGAQAVGLSAGASAPEVLVQQVIARLHELGIDRLTQLEGITEAVVFPLPKGLA